LIVSEIQVIHCYC